MSASLGLSSSYSYSASRSYSQSASSSGSASVVDHVGIENIPISEPDKPEKGFWMGHKRVKFNLEGKNPKLLGEGQWGKVFEGKFAGSDQNLAIKEILIDKKFYTTVYCQAEGVDPKKLTESQLEDIDRKYDIVLQNVIKEVQMLQHIQKKGFKQTAKFLGVVRTKNKDGNDTLYIVNEKLNGNSLSEYLNSLELDMFHENLFFQKNDDALRKIEEGGHLKNELADCDLLTHYQLWKSMSYIEDTSLSGFRDFVLDESNRNKLIKHIQDSLKKALKKTVKKFHKKTGLIHRDLACDNVFVEFKKGQFKVKLIDFGLSLNKKDSIEKFLEPSGSIMHPQVIQKNFMYLCNQLFIHKRVANKLKKKFKDQEKIKSKDIDRFAVDQLCEIIDGVEIDNYEKAYMLLQDYISDDEDLAAKQIGFIALVLSQLCKPER